jgi:AraC family transcriptional regulator of adaptative response/methylated-DNA-[protein]-cysteine methyltransferase
MQTGSTQLAAPLSVAWFDSPVGTLVGGATDDAVLLLQFADDMSRMDIVTALERRFARPVTEAANPHLMTLSAELSGYFGGTLKQFSVPLSYDGSGFQRDVWGELLRIPYGEVRSYQDIADALGMPNATRAVGHANGQNRIAIVIPCHRVVNSGGALGGYGGGLWRKRKLLDLEHGQQGLGF